MEMCYDDASCTGGEQYPDTAVGADTLTNIDTDSSPLYLSVPTDPKDSGSQQYTWTEGTNQYYCVYVLLEGGVDNNYYCASNTPRNSSLDRFDSLFHAVLRISTGMECTAFRG